MGTNRLESSWLRHLDQHELDRYARVSGDLNPIHLDREQALRAGHPDIICQGMLAMTDIGSWLTQMMPGWRLKTLSCRFLATVPVQSRLLVSASHVDGPELPQSAHATLNFTARDQNRTMKASGQAIFRKPT